MGWGNRGSCCLSNQMIRIHGYPEASFDFLKNIVYNGTNKMKKRYIRLIATIPILAMTANAFAEDVQASLDAGMNGHLSKPIVMDEVVKTIMRNLSH